MSQITLSEAQLRDIIQESVEEALGGQNGFFSRFKNATQNIGDNIKNTLMGNNGNLTNISNSWKLQKALEYYEKWLNLFTQANQAYAQVNTKANKAFGTSKNAGYQSAMNFAKNGYKQNTPAPVSENVDESMWTGIKSGMHNVADNFHNKPISQLFTGTKAAYNQGDVAGDAENYKALKTQSNQAWRDFTVYCQSNGIDIQQVKQAYSNQNRQNVLTGKDNSRLAAARAQRDGGSFGGSQTGGGFADMRKNISSKAQNANRDFSTRGNGMWEEKKLDEAISKVIDEAIKKILK